MLSASQYPIVPFANLITDLKNGVEIRTYAADGYRYLRVSDLGEHGIENHNPRYVDVEEIPEKIRLTENSFLVSRSGSLGLVSVVENEIRDAILSSHIFKVNLDTTQVRPRYLEAVLRSQIGQVQFFRNNNGAVIPEISQSALKSILVVLPPPGIQNHIVTIMQSAYAQKARKEQEADALLESIDGYVLAELGIEMPTVEEKRCYVVRAGQLVGRIDPEYNHPKLEVYKEPKAAFSCKSIKALSTEITTGSGVRQDLRAKDGKYPYYGANGIIGSMDTYNYDGRYLVVGKDGSIGNHYVVDGKFWSSEHTWVVAFREDVNLDYVKAFLDAWNYKYLITGGVVPGLPRKAFESVLVPSPPFNVQENIAHEVMSRKSEAARFKQEADAILEAAKEQVERILLQEGSA